MNRTITMVGAVLGGAACGLAAWLLLVPWDLSELDAAGVAIEGGGDANAGAIAIVAVSLLVVGLVLAVARQTRAHAAAFAFGGFIAWAVLFGWRAGTARVNGANFFMIPLVFAVIPSALIAPLIVRAPARKRGERTSEL